MAEKTSTASEVNKTEKVKKKRLSKEQRKHLRRVKQEARKAITTHS